MDEPALPPRPVAGRLTWAVLLLAAGLVFGALAGYTSLHVDLVGAPVDQFGQPRHDARTLAWLAVLTGVPGVWLLATAAYWVGATWDRTHAAVRGPGFVERTFRMPSPSEDQP